MPPNHQTPIEEADLWDVLDWDSVAELSETATTAPTPETALAHVAKKLIEFGAKEGDEDLNLKFFRQVFTRFVGTGSAAERRRRAADLALMFGANPERLRAFAAFKWGLFK